MEEQLVNQQENEPVDIHPLKKGKRILVFLADFFLHFIATFLFFNVAIAPIGKVITNYEDKNNEHIALTEDMYNHYYKSGVLLKNDSFVYYDATAGVEYTYRCFLSYYVIDTVETTDPNVPQYGHKIENEAIRHFYVDIRNNEDLYITRFKDYNSKDNYFEYDESLKSFYLKNEVKTELYSYFDVKDEMGSVGQQYYDNISDNLFNPLMAEVMSDIDKNDLHYEGEKQSFLGCKNRIQEIETYHENLMTICAIIAHVISWIGLFLIFPLIHPNRKTVAMVFMRIERVDFFSLNHVKRGPYIINSIYSLFSNLLGIMFVPSLLVAFNNLFALRFLMYGTIFSLVLIIADLIFVLANQYNRSLVDFLTNNLYLTEDEMDELYRAKGYKI